MMISCSEKISPDQITNLITYRDNPMDFDYTIPEYTKLLDFNLNLFNVDTTLTEEQQKGPVQMNKQERAM